VLIFIVHNGSPPRKLDVRPVTVHSSAFAALHVNPVSSLQEGVSVSNVNRNDPCPCGSGKKYKKCCMLKERDLSAVRAGNREAVQDAVTWITRDHGNALARWVEDVWFAGIDAGQRKGISTADQSIKHIHDTNLLEYMIAEGVFTPFVAAEGEDESDAGKDAAIEEANTELNKQYDGRSVLQLILDAGSHLSEMQCDYLKSLATHPLRLYQVSECVPGDSFTLQAFPPAEKAESICIEDKWISRQLEPGDTVGLRLLQTGGAWETSGAVYHIPAEYLDDLQAELDKAGKDGYAGTLIRFWLGLVAAHV